MSYITEDEKGKWKDEKLKGIEYQGENLGQYTKWGEGWLRDFNKSTKNEW